MATLRGRFVPKKPEKYVGNVSRVIFRSSWELRFMQWLDTNNAVKKWGSEELSIPYVSPTDGKVHRYFPDFIIMYQDQTGILKRELIEIKPYKQSVQTPKMSDAEKLVLAINEAKWAAASDYAQKNGALFRVLTEKTIFAHGQKAPKSKRKQVGRSV